MKKTTYATELVSDMVNKFAMTQTEIAQYCGLSQPAIHEILHGGGAKDETVKRLKALYAREYPHYKKRILRAAAALK